MADTLSSQELDEIAGVLNESASETMAICLERDFKELYLPVFSGEVVNGEMVMHKKIRMSRLLSVFGAWTGGRGQGAFSTDFIFLY